LEKLYVSVSIHLLLALNICSDLIGILSNLVSNIFNNMLLIFSLKLCSRYEMDKKCEPQYDPLHPIECLQTHLKEVVLRHYSGHEKQVDFARFFVLNAKVLSKIEFQAYGDYSNEPVAYQHRLLQVENSVSRDVQFEIRSNCRWHDCHLKEHIHNLSVWDPFKLMPGRCAIICRPCACT
jgi:hypothetical protein